MVICRISRHQCAIPERDIRKKGVYIWHIQNKTLPLHPI